MHLRARTTILFVLVTAAVLVSPASLAADAARVEVVSDDGERIVLEVAIRDYAVDTVDINGEAYARVKLPAEALLLERGAPSLPHVNRSLIIPDDGTVSVRIVASSFEEKPLRVAPSKGILPRTVDPDAVPYDFGTAYQTDAFYPGELAFLGEPYILRDHRGVVVQIQPFQVNPVTGVLRVYTQMTLEVWRTGPGGANVLEQNTVARRPVRAFQDLYAAHFLNAAEHDAATFYSPMDEEGEMLIIAHDPWMINLDAFVAHKATMGITAEVVGVSTIGNTATAIKSYIQSVYDSSNLAYVLLVGDAAQVATPIRPVGAEQGAADPLYSKLAGSDDYPEVMVGRFSALAPAEVDTQVQRTIAYETAPATSQPWFKRGVGVASAEGAGAGDEGQSDREHIGQIRTWLLGDGYTLVDEIYDPFATDTQVANAVNAGRGVINYCGHGSATSWGTTGFNVADVDALVNDNMLPFVVAVACNNGEFHHYDKCFAEAWLRATNDSTGEPTGAIGMYASSVSQSWAPPMEGQDEFNLKLTDAQRPYHSFGAMCFAGSSSMMDKYGAGGVEMFDTWIVFGDPSVRISGPAGLTVTPSSGLTSTGPAGGPYDTTSLTYTLKNNDEAPIEYAVEAGTPWIRLDRTSGTLAPQETVTVTVILDEASRNLDHGRHTDTVRFVNRTGHIGDTTRPVVLQVGGPMVLHRWMLDGADPGWSRQGEWQFGRPTGNGGGQGLNPDPAAGATGANVYGANLAGNISKSLGGPYYLTHGPAGVSGCTDLTLKFRRWLNTWGPPDMAARVEVSTDGVSWTSVWSASATVSDNAWSPQTLDVSSVADGAESLHVRWGYQVVARVPSAGSGWNLDDVEVHGTTPTARATLLVDRTLLSWTSIPAAIGYDVVRGDLRTLRESGGDFALATQGCLANDLSSTSLGYTEDPLPDEGAWFLVRGVSLAGPMTYQSLAGRQVGLRDAEIQAASVNCP